MRAALIKVIIVFLITSVFGQLSYAGAVFTSRRLMPGERVVGPKCKKKFDQKFRATAASVVRQALSNGWKGYDGVDFNELILRIESDEIHVGCWPKNIRIQEMNKSGAMYNWEMRSITLNYIMQTEVVKPEQFRIMAVHEFMGALGYRDREGEASLAILFMSENVNDGLKLLPDGLIRNIQLSQNEGGTSTGTGGGGDPFMLNIKQQYFVVFYNETAEELRTGKIDLKEAQRRIRRFLEVKITYFIAERRAEEPKYELTRYFYSGVCSSDFSRGFGITVGVDFLAHGQTAAHLKSYYMVEALAKSKGDSVRCEVD